MQNKKFFYALASLVGMIVGVGIFGIPYAFSRAGFLIGFLYLLILGGAILLIHLCYGEITLRTSGAHRLVGYAEKYLGPKGKKITGAIIIFEFYGALLAYLIAGGHFLNMMLGGLLGGSDFSWTMIFFVLGSLAILLGLRTIAASEFFMTIFMLAIAVIFIFKGAPLISLANFKGVNFMNFFLPYGVILFSLTGAAAIPEMRQILKGSEAKLKKAIIWGTIIPVIIYFLFAFVIVGIAGPETPKNAIDFLSLHFGQAVTILGAVFGFLAVATSFLILGLNLRRVFQYDYKLKGGVGWFLACFIPLILFLIGINDFIFVIGLVGAVAGGLEGIMMVLIYRRAKKLGDRQSEFSLKIGGLVLSALVLIFALGIVYQIVYLF